MGWRGGVPTVPPMSSCIHRSHSCRRGESGGSAVPPPGNLARGGPPVSPVGVWGRGARLQNPPSSGYILSVCLTPTVFHPPVRRQAQGGCTLEGAMVRATKGGGRRPTEGIRWNPGARVQIKSGGKDPSPVAHPDSSRCLGEYNSSRGLGSTTPTHFFAPFHLEQCRC